MKQPCLIILSVLFFSIFVSCENSDNDSLNHHLVYIAPADLSGVKLEFQDEKGSSEGDLTLNNDGTAEMYQISGWISSNYSGSYVYERHGAEEAVIYASYNFVETNVGGSLVSESTDLSEQYFLFFNDTASGTFSRFSGSNDMDGTFTVVAIE